MDKTEMLNNIQMRGWCTPRQALEAVFEGWENPTEADFDAAIHAAAEWIAPRLGREMTRVVFETPDELEKAKADMEADQMAQWKDAFEYLTSLGSEIGKDALSKFPD